MTTTTITPNFGFYPSTNGDSGLEECAHRLLDERRQRYTDEIRRLLAKAKKYSWAADEQQLSEELAAFETKGGEALARFGGPAALQRARRSYKGDVEMILSHLSSHRRAAATSPRSWSVARFVADLFATGRMQRNGRSALPIAS